jgi:tetratricopeptide (TPR) repeat protein
MSVKARTVILQLALGVLAAIYLFSCASSQNQEGVQEADIDKSGWEPFADTRRGLYSRTISFQVEDAPLTKVITVFEELTGLEVKIAPVIDTDVTLTLRIRDIVIVNVLHLITGQVDCGWEIAGSDSILFTEKRPEGMDNEQLSRHYYSKGKTLFDKHDYDKAKWYFRRAVQCNPDNNKAIRMLHRATFILEVPNRPLVVPRKQALTVQALKELERDYKEGERLFEAAEYEQAKKHYEQCLELIRWFPYPLDTGKDYESLCKQAVYECDHRLRDQAAKEGQSKEEK